MKIINKQQLQQVRHLSAKLSDDSDGVIVEDIFGRSITHRGITLVDWEGYIANPVIKFFVLPPTRASFPIKAVLSADNPRLYFNLPSTVGPHGQQRKFCLILYRPKSQSTWETHPIVIHKIVKWS
jgi:hypothetical protein